MVVGCRFGLDPELRWVWCGLVATSPIGPLTWKPLCTADEALERKKKKKNLKIKIKKIKSTVWGHACSQAPDHSSSIVHWEPKCQTLCSVLEIKTIKRDKKKKDPT